MLDVHCWKMFDIYHRGFTGKHLRDAPSRFHVYRSSAPTAHLCRRSARCSWSTRRIDWGVSVALRLRRHPRTLFRHAPTLRHDGTTEIGSMRAVGVTCIGRRWLLT